MTNEQRTRINELDVEIRRLEDLLTRLVDAERMADARTVYAALKDAREDRQMTLMPASRRRRLHEKLDADIERQEFFVLLRAGLHPEVPASLRPRRVEAATIGRKRGRGLPPGAEVAATRI